MSNPMTMHYAPPGAVLTPYGALPLPDPDLTHLRGRRAVLSVALLRLEDLREGLIAKLDAIDGDPDLESTGDEEPSLCSFNSGTVGFVGDDREADGCDDEEDGTSEHLLGWSEREALTGRLGSSDDREETCEDEGVEEGL